MATDRDQLYRKMAARGKYQRLYTYLGGLSKREWRTTLYFNLDEVLPVHSAGGWPEDLSLRREEIYEDRI